MSYLQKVWCTIESTIRVKVDGAFLHSKIEVFTNSSELFDSFSESFRIGDESALHQLGNSYAVLDMNEVHSADPGDEGISSIDYFPEYREKLNGSDSISIDPEDGGGEVYTRGVCLRPYVYDPYKNNRWSSGIVGWANNPASAGFSVKDEKDYSGYSKNLRCPKGAYATDYSVDGVYRRSWSFVAYKVPDHCTATKEKIGGKWAFRCCCNSAMTQLKGRCEFLNALEHPTWPDSPKSTCS